MTPIAEIVDAGALIEVVWTAFVAGIGVCAIYSVAIVGFSRGLDMRREGSVVGMAFFFGLMALAFAVVMAVVVFGVLVMTSK